MPSYKKCKYCEIEFNEHDPEWIKWCDCPGFCSMDCFDIYETILQYGEGNYYFGVAEEEKDTDYGKNVG